MKNDDEWYGLEVSVSDDEMKEYVANKEDCDVEEVEVLRYGGVVIGRRKREEK